ncbi:MAG: hypothetical protein IJ928_01255 [Prevotella sp.]|nr:hypothetical protein [Prevotella sp.]
MMKKCFLLLCFALATTSFLRAQQAPEVQEKHTGQDCCFIKKLHNEEFKIFLEIDLLGKAVTVPGQEVFGELDGYMGSEQSETVWPVVASEIDGRIATLDFINNYGSEDFTATLTLNDDGTYTFRHLEGSVLKFPVKGKWQKIPAKFILTPIGH